MILNNGHTSRRTQYLAEKNTQKLFDYYQKWGLKCNTLKTQAMIFGRQHWHVEQRGISIVNPQTRNIEIINPARKLSYLGVTISRTLKLTLRFEKWLGITKFVVNCFQGIIGRYGEVDVYIKWRVIRACVLPSQDYGTGSLLPLYNKMSLRKMETPYENMLKEAAGLPIIFRTADLWTVTGENPFVKRLCEIHRNNLDKLRNHACPYLRGLTPEDCRPYDNPSAKANILYPIQLPLL